MTQLALSLEPAPIREADWNTRWLRCCAAHGVRPETSPRDVGGWLWVSGKVREWRAAHGMRPDDPLHDEHHQAIDAWLAERYPYPWPMSAPSQSDGEPGPES